MAVTCYCWQMLRQRRKSYLFFFSVLMAGALVTYLSIISNWLGYYYIRYRVQPTCSKMSRIYYGSDRRTKTRSTQIYSARVPPWQSQTWETEELSKVVELTVFYECFSFRSFFMTIFIYKSNFRIWSIPIHFHEMIQFSKLLMLKDTE